MAQNIHNETTYHLLLIGAGNMGAALLRAWLQAEIVSAAQVGVVEAQEEKRQACEDLGVKTYTTLPPAPCDVIVLAVKPQSLDAVLHECGALYGNTPLYISIAAGKTLTHYAQYFPHAAVVRAMPNTPALIQQGATVLVANTNTTDQQKSLATRLFGAAGACWWLEEESNMDAVTAVSGSGPAYLFALGEALEQAAIRAGIPENMARELVRKMLAGSTALAQESTHSYATLRTQVTSPGGTTEAGLQVLMPALVPLIQETVQAALIRAKDLR